MRPTNYIRYFDKHSTRWEKIRLIFFPFLLLTLSVIALCCIAHWYFVHEKGMKNSVIDLVIVFVAAFTTFIIQRRINLIENKKEYLNRLLWGLCAMSMLIPALCLQTYINKSIGELTPLNDITEIVEKSPTRFYTVENTPYIARYVSDFTYIKSAGRRTDKQKLDTYCVAPVCFDFPSSYTTWLGQMYRSQAFYPEYKQTVFDSFVPTSVQRFKEDIRKPFGYLERITLTEDNGYYRALGLSGTRPHKIIMLVPHYEPFEQRAGNSLNYALLAYFIGAGLFLSAVIFLPFNERRLHCFLTGERYKDSSDFLPSKVVKGKKAANDKVIVVCGITKQKLENDLKDLCDAHNGDGGNIYPEVRQTGETEFIITFPYDIDFVSFCYLINFLCYPVSGGDKAEVTGWTKAIAGDSWITKRIAGKQLMLYVPDEDKEYDNVYVTTESGDCYKFGFDGKTVLLPKPFRPYRKMNGNI